MSIVKIIDRHLKRFFFCQKHVRERSKNLLTNHQGSRVLVTRFSLLIFAKDSFTRHFFLFLA